VLAGHLLITNNISASPAVQLLLDIRDLLWVGVTLFFALSGFLITGILYDTLGSERYFRTFFARRALRIFPLYYGVLLLLLLLTRPLHFNWHGEAWRLFTYTTNIPFTYEWVSNPSPYINLRHFWSLAVEEQFYLLWPLAIFLLRSWRRVLAATLIGAGLSLVFRTSLALNGWAPQNHTLFGSMDALLLGGALALLVRSHYREQALRWGTPVFLCALAVTLAEAFSHRNFDWWSSTYLATIGMTILGLGMAALVAASLKPHSIVQRFCTNPVLRFFGRYSYGLYVYHYSVDNSLTFSVRRVLEAHGAPKPLAILGGAMVVCGISVVLAVLSYHLYEVHFLKLKRFIPNPRRVKTQDLDSVPVHQG
jgi:peptidoglycan/LPS O-acetylase OafA/YrhL